MLVFKSVVVTSQPAGEMGARRAGRGDTTTTMDTGPAGIDVA